MTQPAPTGRYRLRIAQSHADIARAQALRSLCFGAPDQDAYDVTCTHILIEEAETAALVCCFRVLLMQGPEITQSYSAQYYDLSALSGFDGPLLELGRFCIHPKHPDPDILRMAWAFLTRWVDDNGVRLLFGCASFSGDHPGPHLAAFAQLYAQHQAPPQWRPRPKSPRIFDFASELFMTGQATKPSPNRPVEGIPPLLRTYLLMGGWVSDHAVFDHGLKTMHVFTAVETATIPPARARLLRVLAGGKG